MSRYQPGQEILTYLDTKIILRRSVLLILFLIIFLPLCAIWYTSKGIIASMRRDVVQICELNENVFKTPEYPFINDFGCYAQFRTIREAEDWLLERGYKCRYVWTRISFDDVRDLRRLDVTYSEYEDSHYKTFFTKGQPGSPYESIVMITVDYGDHDKHLYPFRCEDKNSPIDYSRFDRIELPKTQFLAETGLGCRCNFELLYYSTHYDGPGIYGLIGEKWPSGVYNPKLYEEENERKNADEEAYLSWKAKQNQFLTSP